MKTINEIFFVRKDPDYPEFDQDSQWGFTDLARLADRYDTEEDARKYMRPGSYKICRVTVEVEELPDP